MKQHANKRTCIALTSPTPSFIEIYLLHSPKPTMLEVVVASNDRFELLSPSIEKPAVVAISDNESIVIDMDELTQATTGTGEDMSSSEWGSQDDSTSTSAEEDAVSRVESSEESLSYAEYVRSTSSDVKRSIMRRRFSDGVYIKNTRGAWQCLPKPDLELIRRNSDAMADERPPSSDGNSSDLRKNSVVFGQVVIRSYSQTLGNNPSVSYGPPISLDWDYEQHEAITLDDYEDNRKPRRTPRQMVLSYYTRKNILMWKYGVDEIELKHAQKQAEQEKMRRNITITMLPIMKVEAALESAKRKAKRAFGKKASS